MSFPARWRVLKFGGTSVADPSAWPLIARTVRQHRREGARPLLVCSAFSKVTDLLVKLCSELRGGACPDATVAALRARHEERAQALGLDLSGVPEAVELLDRIASIARAGSNDATLLTPALEAELLAMGERLSTLVGAAWLNANGLRAHWLDARRVLQLDAEAGQPEADSYLAAEVVSDLRGELSAELAKLDTDVIITQGFIAQNDAGETVVLGRGGSDTAASAIAATLGAELVEIWTDVPGVLTTDPRLTPRARLIEELTLETMEAMAGRGAKVLHPRCLAPVRRAGIPLAIRWTRHPDIGCGTALVAGATHTQRPGAAAVTLKRNVIAFSLDRERHWQPVGFLAEVSACFQSFGISMDVVASSPSSIRTTVDLDAFPGLEGNLDALIERLSAVARPAVRRDVAVVSVVGEQVSADLGRIFARVGALPAGKVMFLAHAADDHHMSWVVDASVADDLVRLLHDAVFADRTDEHGPTWSELRTGTVTAADSSAVSAVAS